MKTTTRTLALCTMLMSAAAAAPAQTEFSLIPVVTITQRWHQSGVELEVMRHHSRTPYLAAVLVSLQPHVCRTYEGVPPLLCESAVLAMAFVHPGLAATIENKQLPKDAELFAQGVVADENGIATTMTIRVANTAVDGAR